MVLFGVEPTGGRMFARVTFLPSLALNVVLEKVDTVMIKKLELADVSFGLNR